MRWLVDESLPRALAEWLRARGDDVLDVAVSPWRGAADHVLWRLAAESQRVITTRDLGFLLHAQEPHPPGIVLIRVPDADGRRRRSPG
ncbi:DUF5615 family PIN-like protein [Thermoflexus hugenholtzii]